MFFHPFALLLLVCCLAASSPGEAAPAHQKEQTDMARLPNDTSTLHPLEKQLSYEDPRLSLHIQYPVFGHPHLDGHIKEWAQSIADLFRVQAEEMDILPDIQSKKFMQISYKILIPSPHALSLIMYISSRTTGSHNEMQQILVRSYSPNSGTMLEFNDLFKKPRTALTLLSLACDKDLQRQLGDEADIWWIKEGTEPTEENFTALALISGGLRIFFQPYQVAPSVKGILFVDVPLQMLLAAQPNTTLWDHHTETSLHKGRQP